MKIENRWKNHINDMIKSIARSHSYFLFRTYVTSYDFDDPKATTIHLFHSEQDFENSPIIGVFLVFPSDYAFLASIDSDLIVEDTLKTLLFKQWIPNYMKAGNDFTFMKRIEQIAIDLYSLPRLKDGFPISMKYGENNSAVSIKIDTIILDFTEDELRRLQKIAPIDGCTSISNKIQEQDEKLSNLFSN